LEGDGSRRGLAENLGGLRHRVRVAREIDLTGKNDWSAVPELHQEVIGTPTERTCFFEVNAFAFSGGGV
jgi:hypothetical protein